jgi:hypothetical protein
MIGIYYISDGEYCERAGTFVSRLTTDYDMDSLEGLRGDAYYNMLDEIRQPESAKVAVHEGKLLGKGIGNTQCQGAGCHTEKIFRVCLTKPLQPLFFHSTQILLVTI